MASKVYTRCCRNQSSGPPEVGEQSMNLPQPKRQRGGPSENREPPNLDFDLIVCENNPTKGVTFVNLPVFNRRSLFFRASIAGFIGSLPGGSRLAAAMAAKAGQDSRKVYTRLGLRPIVNASGTYTHLGGSLMPPEVIAAMNDAARHYVPIRDLTRATGERIAQLTGNPAALVTTGAAGAIFTGTCACIGGSDPDKMKRLPFTDGMKNEVILQKLHNTGWTRQCEAAGARMVEVESKDELEKAIGSKTAMIYFLVADKHFGQYRD